MTKPMGLKRKSIQVQWQMAAKNVERVPGSTGITGEAQGEIVSKPDKAHGTQKEINSGAVPTAAKNVALVVESTGITGDSQREIVSEPDRAQGTQEEINSVAVPMAAKNVALVAGSTGITGQALVENLSKPDSLGGPWKVYGIARRRKPDWHTPDVYVRCNFKKREETCKKVSPMADVTHVFWVAWVDQGTDKDRCVANRNMLQNLLDALLPNAKSLKHICLQTGGKHYLGTFQLPRLSAELTDSVYSIDAPFTEDVPRLPYPNFFYTLEDVLFKAVERKQEQGEKLTWSVHRPGVIFGFTVGNNMNILSTLSVYGCLCKELGLPFIFPGTEELWNAYCDASDADLVAEQHIWAATDPRAENQAFNSMNGDVFKWKTVWMIFADRLGMEAVPPPSGPSIPFHNLMGHQGLLWQQLVKRYSLNPTQLRELGHWRFVERLFAIHDDNSIMSCNKSKEFGFLKFRDTLKGVEKHLNTYVDWKIIPDMK